ncbi:type II toxin-antitoxin system HicB family antitoxin [Scytonema hofmannii FACHB-248]|uniref:Type II toxin-antitoxin system HicB family antitoxin n=1 Tax=Scytonema hofmannii FACHB-248 TaxID=1842502 RepID=A0ABR8GQK0_9CYAN|nr:MULTISPECIES: type II toxin-antitoxin system HicB family antitoxin [Nostocales]MBD2605330.1 type II toxin-antitoxin system HicB family antitoxin [Scytonema hofmannii FACHB-248]
MPLKYYLNLQYPVKLYPEREGGYVAKIKDLLTQGETLDETMAKFLHCRLAVFSDRKNASLNQ